MKQLYLTRVLGGDPARINVSDYSLNCIIHFQISQLYGPSNPPSFFSRPELRNLIFTHPSIYSCFLVLKIIIMGINC